MNPVSPWIAALADQCLSFYLGQNDQNDQDEIQVEDFEGCLIFIIRRPTLNTAVVVSVRYLKWMWRKGIVANYTSFVS